MRIDGIIEICTHNSPSGIPHFAFFSHLTDIELTEKSIADLLRDGDEKFTYSNITAAKTTPTVDWGRTMRDLSSQFLNFQIYPTRHMRTPLTAIMLPTEPYRSTLLVLKRIPKH